jgi:hypothetical protein
MTLAMARIYIGVVVVAASGMAGIAASELRTELRQPLPMAKKEIKLGREWQAVFVGDLECWPSNRASLVPAVRRILESFHDDVTAAGDNFSSLGVALDFTQRDGRAFLAKYGEFDETAIGRSWLNMAALHLMLRDEIGPPVTPTVILLTRSIESDFHDNYVVGPDSIVLRIVGGPAILKLAHWLSEAGTGTMPDGITYVPPVRTGVTDSAPTRQPHL